MKKIAHRGEVRAVESGLVRVAIVASGACHACRARDLCGMGESEVKIIEVKTPEAEHYTVGEEVLVSEEQRIALRAVLLAYVGALVVLLATLLGALAAGCSEGWAALLSLAGVAVYYGVIYLCQTRIEKTIYFTITKC